jgi:hypothetical protein
MSSTTASARTSAVRPVPSEPGAGCVPTTGERIPMTGRGILARGRWNLLKGRGGHVTGDPDSPRGRLFVGRSARPRCRHPRRSRHFLVRQPDGQTPCRRAEYRTTATHSRTTRRRRFLRYALRRVDAYFPQRPTATDGCPIDRETPYSADQQACAIVTIDRGTTGRSLGC